MLGVSMPSMMQTQLSDRGAMFNVSRRSLLMGSFASLAGLSACTQPASTLPTGFGTSSAGAPRGSREPASLANLVRQKPFYIAHRGGRLNWPEMTAFAYGQAAALPFVQAIEVSVHLTKDGVLVCSHDANLERVTGASYEVRKANWAQLEHLVVTSAYTDNPTQPYRPLSRLDEVLPRYIRDLVVFVEPKSKDAIRPLQEMLEGLNQPERTVWKQPVNQPNFSWAKQRGFGTWGYVLDERGHKGERLERLVADPSIHMLGVERTRSDNDVATVVRLASSLGKPTIMWSIETAEHRSRALRLGCRGMMAADIRNLPTVPL